MDRAALYLRLSKEDADKLKKGDDSESIVNQRLLLMDYAIRHDMEVVDVYSDDDYSGLYEDRPEFHRLIRDGKLGKFNVVLAKTQSRFTRNMEHMEKYLHHDFPLLGIRFIGVVDGVDTQNGANKKSRQINGLVNEWYCEDLSRNIRAVFQQKMKDGQFLGAFAPYGYRKDPENKYHLIVDEDAAGVVQEIFRLFLEGYSTKAICHILEDRNIPNPALYKREQGLTYRNVKAEEFGMRYRLWSETTVKRILSNETYLGKLVQGTCQKASYKDKKIVAVPREEWYIVEGCHEPIIDEHTFLQAARLRGRRRLCSRKQPEEKKVHVFAGMLRCADCGHTMIKSGGVRGAAGDWYLRCQLSNKSRQKECSSHSIRYSAVEQAVFDKIREQAAETLAEEGNLKELLEFSEKKSGPKPLPARQKELENVKKALENITKSVKALYFDRVSQNIEEELFFQLKEELERERAQWKRKQERMETEIANLAKGAEGRENEKAEGLRRFFTFPTLTHELVNGWIDYIEVGEKDRETKEQEIVIHWKF